MAKGKVGVKFGTSHSYASWGLRLKSVEITMPDAKIVTVDVEGMDGVLDLTEAQNGEVCYTNRKLTFVFDAVDVSYRQWTTLLSKIAYELHGRKKKIILDFDPEYYYTGRCNVRTTKNNDVKADIVVECDVGPYKMHIASDGEEWLWDTFSFKTGIIRKPYSFTIDSAESWQEVRVRGYEKNVSVKFQCSAPMEVKYDDVVYDIAQGDSDHDEIILNNGMNTMYVRGIGTIEITPRGGML